MTIFPRIPRPRNGRTGMPRLEIRERIFFTGPLYEYFYFKACYQEVWSLNKTEIHWKDSMSRGLISNNKHESPIAIIIITITVN